MEYSPFLAKWLGFYLVIVGLATIWNRERMPMIIDDLIQSSPYTLLTGAISVLFGLFLILIHNVWVMNLSVLITIIGYLSLFRGLLHLFFPEVIPGIAKMLSTPRSIIIYSACIIL